MPGEKLVQHIPMIMTRPVASNGSFVAQIPEHVRSRLDILECPLIKIRDLYAKIELGFNESAIFTSGNALPFVPLGEGRRAYCVGQRTTKAAEDAGWAATMAGQNAEELIDWLKNARPREPLCHLSGLHVRKNLVDALTPLGFAIRQVAVYDQDLLALEASALDLISSNKAVLVPLFSPRAARHFAVSVPTGVDLNIIAMSEAVAREWTQIHRSEPVIAARPTAQAMIFEIEKIVLNQSLG